MTKNIHGMTKFLTSSIALGAFIITLEALAIKPLDVASSARPAPAKPVKPKSDDKPAKKAAKPAKAAAKPKADAKPAKKAAKAAPKPAKADPKAPKKAAKPAKAAPKPAKVDPKAPKKAAKPAKAAPKPAKPEITKYIPLFWTHEPDTRQAYQGIFDYCHAQKLPMHDMQTATDTFLAAMFTLKEETTMTESLALLNSFLQSPALRQELTQRGWMSFVGNIIIHQFMGPIRNLHEEIFDQQLRQNPHLVRGGFLPTQDQLMGLASLYKALPFQDYTRVVTQYFFQNQAQIDVSLRQWGRLPSETMIRQTVTNVLRRMDAARPAPRVPQPASGPAPAAPRPAAAQRQMNRQSVETAHLAARQAEAYKNILENRLGHTPILDKDPAAAYLRRILAKNAIALRQLNRMIPLDIARNHGLVAGTDGELVGDKLYISVETYGRMTPAKKNSVKGAFDQASNPNSRNWDSVKADDDFNSDSRAWHLINAGLTEYENVAYALFNDPPAGPNFGFSYTPPLFMVGNGFEDDYRRLATALNNMPNGPKKDAAELSLLKASASVMDPESYHKGPTHWHRTCPDGWNAQVPPVVGEIYDFTAAEQATIMAAVAVTTTPEQSAAALYESYEARYFAKLKGAHHHTIFKDMVLTVIKNADRIFFSEWGGARKRDDAILTDIFRALDLQNQNKPDAADEDHFAGMKRLYIQLQNDPQMRQWATGVIAAKRDNFGGWENYQIREMANQMFAYFCPLLDHPPGAHLAADQAFVYRRLTPADLMD